MRILLVTEKFPPKIFGGGEISAFLLAKALSKENEIHIISAGPGEKYELEGVQVHPMIKAPPSWLPIDLQRNEAFYLSVLRAILRFLRRYGRFDMIHSTYTRTIGGALLASKLNSIPIIATINDPWATCFFQTHFRKGEICKVCSRQGVKTCLRDVAGRSSGSSFLQFSMRLRRLLVEKCDGLMTNSAAMKDLLRINGIKREIAVIPSAVDIESFRYEKPRLEGEILYIGRVDLGKGADIAIRAFAKAGEGKLVVVGTGTLLEECKKLAKRLGVEDRVEFRGKIPYHSVPSTIHEADVVFVPFQRIEAYGRVLLESNACGRGVITTTIGANHTHIKDGINGLIFEPSDIEGMALAIRNLLSNPDLIEKMGVSGRKIVEENFTIKILGEKVSNFYRTILRKE